MSTSAAAIAVDPTQHPTVDERADRKQRKGYIASLDGWRTIAILWVLYAHYPGRGTTGFLALLSLTGYRGVQLFFAISGFLICTLLLREEQAFGSISLKSFYTRRVFRIQPAAIAYLAIIAILGALRYIPPFWNGITAALLMVRNFWPPASGPAHWATSHFWSLSVEEHFYLLLPGFLVLVRRNRLRILIAAVIALNIWRIIVFRTPALQTFGWILDIRTDVLLGGILLGSVFAVALTKARLHALAQRWVTPNLALLYTAAMFTLFGLHLGGYTFQALTFTYPVLIVATVLHPASWLTRFLELSPVRFIGRISYSLYLWQQVFFWHEIYPEHSFVLRHPLVLLAAVFAVATLSFYFVETPMQRLGHRIAKRFHREPAKAIPAITDPATPV